MKLTKEHILELFKQLPTETICDYVIPGNFTVRRKPIEDNEIHFSLFENSIETQKDVPLTISAMETMANSIIENTPISIDAALVNGGNKRSAIEGALIRTSEFYSIKIGRNKNIVWVPSKPHPVGEKGMWNEDEALPTAAKDDTSSMAVYQEEMCDDYTIEELGKRFAAMVGKEDETGIVTTCVAFGLKYGKAINKNDYKARELVDAANKNGARIDHSQDGNVNTGKSLYMAIERQRFGLHFSKRTNKNGQNLQTLHTLDTYLAALRTKPFLLLAGISGTGKSRIVREFAFKSCPKCLQDKAGTTPGNYCMIEVKPNWHDSTELLGYYSRLGKAGYQFTKFVKFLVKAKMFPNVPFFVCLDEMNLAPVEQYFAEILSILETRKHPKNVETGEVDMETVKTEPIIDAQYFRELAEMPHVKNTQTGESFSSNLTDRDIYLKLFGMDTESDIDKKVGNRTDLTTEGLQLPDNVVIIGTVNMDDTTHQFSRKVIDRAMTIEMNGGNLRNMFGGSKNLEYLAESEQKKWQNAFTRRYVSADEVLDAHPDVAEELMEKLPTKLEEINLALKGTPFMVSYRVLNELTIMVGVMLDEGMGLDEAIAASVNNILLMKILPRVEGDAEMFAISREYKAKAGVSYDNRLEWLKDIAPDIKESSAEAASENDDTEEKTGTVKECQQTAKEKIQEMIDRLNNQEFTRFWP